MQFSQAPLILGLVHLTISNWADLSRAPYLRVHVLLLVYSWSRGGDPLTAVLQVLPEVIIQKVAMLLLIISVPNDCHLRAVIGAGDRPPSTLLTRIEYPGFRCIEAADALLVRFWSEFGLCSRRIKMLTHRINSFVLRLNRCERLLVVHPLLKRGETLHMLTRQQPVLVANLNLKFLIYGVISQCFILHPELK